MAKKRAGRKARNPSNRPRASQAPNISALLDPSLGDKGLVPADLCGGPARAQPSRQAAKAKGNPTPNRAWEAMKGGGPLYSTVTLLARLRGLSTLHPRITAA